MWHSCWTWEDKYCQWLATCNIELCSVSVFYILMLPHFSLCYDIRHFAPKHNKWSLNSMIDITFWHYVSYMFQCDITPKSAIIMYISPPLPEYLWEKIGNFHGTAVVEAEKTKYYQWSVTHIIWCSVSVFYTLVCCSTLSTKTW